MKIVYEKLIPATKPEYKEFEFKSKKINNFIKENSIKLYSHQAEAIEQILKGNDIIVTTPTASGKSLIYTLSILEKIDQNPDTTAILIFPLVALARDQKEKIENLIKMTKIKATVETYYGDTSNTERARIRSNPPNFLITTPDMLNQGILPNHWSWDKFFTNLEFVIVDEIHAYRGVLGSHVANIFRRLNRLTNFYTGKEPLYICNSATIRNPSLFAEKLTGKKNFIEISKSGAPSPKKLIYITEPASNHQLMELIIEYLKSGTSTIVFIDSRKDIEVIYLNIKKELEKRKLFHLIDKVKPYRSGYRQEERREIEKGLANGDITVVLSTSALEMGIDIGEIQCVVLKGFPGTLAAMWQRFGRAGRRGQTAYNYLITKQNALDQYYLKNPEDIFNRNVEEPIINPENKYILKKHLILSAKELPIHVRDIKPSEKEAVKELLEEKILYIDKDKIKSRKKISFSIRSAGDSYNIVDIKTNRSIGNLEQEYVFYEAFPNAVYIHSGETYKVINVDNDDKVVYVEKVDLNYFTQPILASETEIQSIEKSRKFKDIEIFYGSVNVRSMIIGYSKIEIESNKRINDVMFDYKKILERNFATKAVWFTIPDYYKGLIEKNTLENSQKTVLSLLGRKLENPVYEMVLNIVSNSKTLYRKLGEILKENDSNFIKNYLKNLSKTETEILTTEAERLLNEKNIFIGALHGAEHGMIGIYSIFAMNDRWDIGGLSTNYHPQTEKASIFIYDGYEGGIGYAEAGFERLEDILKATYKNIKNCKCLNGCPSCILSPKCGNANEHLDKLATEKFLELVLA
jgi:Distinct helicase family with a unique C-terminal domain including a metal-binding cysteine cluster